MLTHNFVEGHRYLLSTFSLPSIPVAWEIDSFGVSALTPAVLSRFGYRFLVINRIDAEFKMFLRHKGSTEFLWGSGAVGGNGKVFTHVLGSHYELPLFLNPEATEYCFNPSTIDLCARKFVDLMVLNSQFTGNSAVMLLYGGDFAFLQKDGKPSLLFESLDRIVKYFKESDTFKNLRVKISTPSDYFSKVLHSDRSFPTFSGEFFPYMTSRETSAPQYWTGFYTTRPNLKHLIKSTMSMYRSAELLSALVLNKEFTDEDMAEGLHHDAIAGTITEEVARKLNDKMEGVRDRAKEVVGKAAIAMLMKGGIEEKKGEGRPIILVNSLNWPREVVVSVTAGSQFVEVKNSESESIPSQSFHNSTDQSYTIFFNALLPSLSSLVYFLVDHPSACPTCSIPSQPSKADFLSNGEYVIKTSKEGYISHVEKMQYGKMTFQRMEFRKYSSVASGPYVFRPIANSTKFEEIELKESQVWTGPIVSICDSLWSLTANHTFSQRITLPTKHLGYFTLSISTFALGNETMLEMEPFPIPETPWLHTFTDGELRQRVYFDPLFMARIGKNFFPVTNAMVVGNSSFGMEIFPDYPLGAGMFGRSGFSLHLHRSVVGDDGSGLENGCVDTSQATHTFRITLNPVTDSEMWRHSLEHSHPPILFTPENENHWEHSTSASIPFDDPRMYLQSVTTLSPDLILLRVLNLRAFEVDFEMDGRGKKTGLGGEIVRFNGVTASTTKICFETCASGAAGGFWRYLGKGEKGNLQAYEFSAFEVKRQEGRSTQVKWDNVHAPKFNFNLAAYTPNYSPLLLSPHISEPPSTPLPTPPSPTTLPQVSPPVIEPLSEPSNWPTTLLGILCMCAVAAMIWLLCRKKQKPKKPKKKSPLSGLFSTLKL